MRKDKFNEYSQNKIRYIAFFIRHINDLAFIKQILDIRENPMNITFESYGPKNKDKIIYFCNNIAGRGNGFFADYKWLLDALFFADRFGFVPVIDFGEEFCYAESHKVNNTNNSFEYYFEQPCGISVEEALSSYNIVSYMPKDRQMIYSLFSIENGYQATDEYINNLGLISNKYIRLNQHVKPIIENSISKMISNKKTLGIHVRGSDFNMEIKDHPIPVKPNEYFSCIYETIEKYNFEQVFLATDDLITVSLFKEELGNKLVYYEDVTRTDEKVSVAHSKSTRENHHYKLGLEVLRDMQTLANCSGLIAGMSQVSICARITKASINGQYEFLKIFDKGMNRSGVDSLELLKTINENKDKV